MARRSRAQGGFPKDGDELPPDPNPEAEPEVEEEEDEGEIEEEASPEPTDDPVKAIREDMAAMDRRHKEELDTLRRAIPPTNPKELAAAPVAEETDWDNLLFSNPKEAIKRIKAEAVKEAETKLRSEYQQDQGTRKFWDGFYQKNSDLKDDHDLVDLTLQSNLSTLANMPVADAMKKLADLTRERLLRYSGGSKSKGRKAFAEGAAAPAQRRTPAQEPEVTSISDLIRARRAKRRATAA